MPAPNTASLAPESRPSLGYTEALLLIKQKPSVSSAYFLRHFPAPTPLCVWAFGRTASTKPRLSIHRLNTPQRRTRVPALNLHYLMLSSPMQRGFLFLSALTLALGSQPKHRSRGFPSKPSSEDSLSSSLLLSSAAPS